MDEFLGRLHINDSIFIVLLQAPQEPPIFPTRGEGHLELQGGLFDQAWARPFVEIVHWMLYSPEILT